MNNAELFHRWAHQVKPQGKSGNVFYEGPILYSYGHHFPLAVLTGKTTRSGEEGEAREIVLVNSRTYSMTTAHHKSQAVYASSHMMHIFVPYPTPAFIDRAKNLDYLNAETARAVERLEKGRSAVDYSERTARECVATAKLYRKTFLKGRGHVVPLPKDFDALLAKAREREIRHNAAREIKLVDAENIAAWRAGENVGALWGLPCMLRLKGEVVQTSLQAEIPLSHAERVYRLILGIMAKGEDWQTNGHTIPVGVYKVDSIGKDGTLRAGCHTIKFDEIQKFAAAMGW